MDMLGGDIYPAWRQKSLPVTKRPSDWAKRDQEISGRVERDRKFRPTPEASRPTQWARHDSGNVTISAAKKEKISVWQRLKTLTRKNDNVGAVVYPKGRETHTGSSRESETWDDFLKLDTQTPPAKNRNIPKPARNWEHVRSRLPATDIDSIPKSQGEWDQAMAKVREMKATDKMQPKSMSDWQIKSKYQPIVASGDEKHRPKPARRGKDDAWLSKLKSEERMRKTTQLGRRKDPLSNKKQDSAYKDPTKWTL